MKSRFCSPSAMPARCDLNRRIGMPDLASSNRLATRLIISPLWYSLGPNTLKNFRPAHCGGSLSPVSALDDGKIEQLLAPAVEIHRPQAFERACRPIVAIALAAITIGRCRGGINEWGTGSGAPVEQPQR